MGEVSMVGVDNGPMQDKFYTKIVKLGELNKLVYEDLILSSNTSYSVGKVTLDW